jgi:osmoprotectant transport system ATP-binding protein
MSISSGQIALEARAVTKRYARTKALDGVSLTVPRGTLTALVGESGSGKTTLLRSFNRMVRPDAGQIRVDGEDVASVDPVKLRRSLGYVQQEGGLLPHWTIARNAALVPWLQGRTDADAQARAALELVGLPQDTFDRWPGELSGGQRQRAALARALAGERRTLLLDEPFGALDAITRVEVRRTFARIRTELALTVLLVTHDLREAFELADCVAVMKAGVMDQVAAPEALLESPASPYVEELLDKAGVA